MTTYYLKVGDGTDDVLGVTSSVALAYQTGSVEGGDTTLVTITPTLESTGFGLPSDIAVYYRSKLVDGSFGDWQTDNTFTLADGDYEVEAQLRYTSTGNPVVQKLDVDGVTLVDVAAVSTTFTVGADPGPSYDVEISGTTDITNAFGGTEDTDPTVVPSLPMTSVILRGTSDAADGRILIKFANSTDRDAFRDTHLPSGSTVSVIVGGTTYTTTNVSWITANSTTIFADADGGGVPARAFDGWFTTAPVGTSYTIGGTLA